ncbi:MAG: extracellular solute-binding protein [Kofleriaceae bacterium]|nr:extracellular solute-binding protein [Kofleriaceae bacterium]
MFARLIASASLVACSSEPSAPQPIRFLHTFSPAETELFNNVIAERGLRVESALVPFARGQQVIGEILAAKQGCPDLIRIDATWLPGLRAQLVQVPPELATLDWTPEAAELAQQGGAWLGVPQTVDGLVVIRDKALPAPAGPSLDDVIAAARAARTPERPRPLAVRVDGYWFVPWLRAEGADLAAGAIDGDNAVRAVARFAALFDDLAPPPPPSGSEANEELARFQNGGVAYWITGPWQFTSGERMAVSPLAGAPRGGQLLVVPACAAHPEDGWKLAAEITSVHVATRLAQAFSTIPTRFEALAAAPMLSRDAATALREAVPLPRDARTPLLFDDLNPALAAVVAKDATPDEAIAGVRRGWQRLLKGSR